MENLIELPVVTDDFDGQCAALDQAIREAAADFNLTYVAEAPTFDQIYQVPDVVYKLIQHYTMRGFICEYDGDAGKLKISWDYPNMSWLEQREITRAIPDMIPNLGIGFRAAILYLCMTNGQDLRGESNLTLQAKLSREIKAAATLGNTEMMFGFPGVPAPVVTNMFRETFDLLIEKGFQVAYDVNAGVFVVKWGQTFALPFKNGAEATANIA